MSFKGFLRILLVSFVISITLNWLYAGVSLNNYEYLLLGVLVGSNIMAIKWSVWGYKMLLRAHEVVEKWLVISSQNIFGNYAYRGVVLNKGSTFNKFLITNARPLVEDCASKVRIFEEKVKYNFKNLHKSDPVRSSVVTLPTLIDVSQQHNWLSSVPTDELLMWLWQIGVSNANDIHIKQQPFVRLALEELRRRARSERAYNASSLNNELKRRANVERYHELYNDVSPLFEGQCEGFETLTSNKQKPIVRYA